MMRALRSFKTQAICGRKGDPAFPSNEALQDFKKPDDRWRKPEYVRMASILNWLPQMLLKS